MTSPADDTTNNAVPHNTTPTWEMELLVSGGTVFALIQLAGLVDDRFISVMAQTSEEMNQGLNPLWIYVKFVLLTLIGTFISHLCLRGYWVALVGMNSVYPGGVDWEKLRQGPISRKHSESSVPSMSILIERADNLATRVFGIGFGFAMMMLLPIVVVTVSLLGSYVLRRFFGLDHTLWIFILLFMALFLPMAAAAIVDRRIGERFVPGSWTHRALIAIFSFYSRIGMGRTSNILLSLFISRTGLKRWMGLAVLVMGTIFTVSIAHKAISQGLVEFGEYPGLPDNEVFSTASTPSSFYANQRSTEPNIAPLPYISDRIVRGPYVELFIPYRPRHHIPALEKRCPKALAESTEANPRPALACLAKLHAVRLDGKPVSVTFDASNDRYTGQRGMLAMIPVAALRPGRHELSVLEVNSNRDLPEPSEEIAAKTPAVATPKSGVLVSPPTSPASKTPPNASVGPANAVARTDINSLTSRVPRRYRIPFWK